jgi:hypothetical protein
MNKKAVLPGCPAIWDSAMRSHSFVGFLVRVVDLHDVDGLWGDPAQNELPSRVKLPEVKRSSLYLSSASEGASLLGT